MTAAERIAVRVETLRDVLGADPPPDPTTQAAVRGQIAAYLRAVDDLAAEQAREAAPEPSRLDQWLAERIRRHREEMERAAASLRGHTVAEAERPAAAAAGDGGTAADPAPRADAPPAAAFPTLVWTAERNALLREAWPRGDAIPDLMRALNALPGAAPVASPAALRKQAEKLRLRRGPEAAARTASARGVAGALAQAERHAEAPHPILRGPREAEFARLWVETDLTADVIVTRLNAIAGPPPVVSKGALYAAARRLGLPTARPLMAGQVAPAPAAAEAGGKPLEPTAPAQCESFPAESQESESPVLAAEETAPAAAQPEAEPAPQGDAPGPSSTPKDEAWAMFDAGFFVRAVAEDMGEPLGTVANWHAEWKRSRAQEAA